jgi:hypothetical protein
MQFNITHAFCLLSVLLAGGMASPISTENSLAPREAWKPPPIPGCPTGGFNPVTQINQCSSGTPFCCSPSQSGNTCVKADVSCDQTVICCNNNGGVQLCIGGTNINIDMPITINV